MIAAVPLLAILMLESVFSTQAAAEPPGSINGKVAIRIVPDLANQKESTGVGICTVHLVEVDDQTRELAYACGSWFQPPVGRYLFWLEQGSSISFQTVITYAGETFTRSGLALAKTMYPAGYVQLDHETRVPTDGTLRLVALETQGQSRPFDRRIRHADALKQIRMPAGSVIGGIFDRSGRAVSLSKPLPVTPGVATRIRPQPPATGRAIVVALVERSTTSSRPCAAHLVVPRDQVKRPSIDIQANDRLVLAWYDVVAPADARLEVKCIGGERVDRTLRLERGAIETVRTALRKVF